MIIYTSPEIHSSDNTLFLAGGITNCPDWQSDVIDLLKNTDYIIFNPRRLQWNLGRQDSESIKQIEWEYHYLTSCKNLLFWFCKETLCPIVLFELGSALERSKLSRQNIFIGSHPDYKRILDVKTQSNLHGYDKDIYTSLESLVEDLIR